MPQGFDRIHACGSSSRVESEEESYEQRDPDAEQDAPEGDAGFKGKDGGR